MSNQADLNSLFSGLIKVAVTEALAASDKIAEIGPPPEITELEILKHKEYLNGREVEKLYGLKQSTLKAWRGQSRGPEYSRDGDLILYRRADVEAYLKFNRVRTYDQPGDRSAIHSKRRQ